MTQQSFPECLASHADMIVLQPCNLYCAAPAASFQRRSTFPASTSAPFWGASSSRGTQSLLPGAICLLPSLRKEHPPSQMGPECGSRLPRYALMSKHQAVVGMHA